MRTGRAIRVSGVVQGVGFRPFIHRLATELGVDGIVGNDSAGVFIEAESDDSGRLDLLVSRITGDAPPAASVGTVSVEHRSPWNRRGFEIVDSVGGGRRNTLISADLAMCSDCDRELFDPDDRRFLHPFITCTNCGPRFTITRSVPYDRPNTTLSGFPMCPACRREYEDPTDRRFHAQPISCWECGPRLWFEEDGARVDDDPITAARRLVAEGGILAVKGIGGFHLACDARSADAVEALRGRKGRVSKPFAVMAADLDTASSVSHLDAEAIRLLQSIARPIVLAPERQPSDLADAIAPGNRDLGVMLPYTPIHRLLLEPGDVWVMTSGNLSQEPICHDNDEARTRLGELADAFLLHDRDIVVPVDDSVSRSVSGGHPQPVRRSRGFVPFPVELDFEPATVLAVGGELKATFCVTRGGHAFMSQHIGDMENLETLGAFERAVEHMLDVLDVRPEVIACDMHPGYLSRSWAIEHAAGAPVVEVQHHHAHAASLLAEHRISEDALVFSFDGTGYGLDGTIWGGEVLEASVREFSRWAHLSPSALPGGDAAVRRPYRQALARLGEAGIGWDTSLPPVGACPQSELGVLERQLERGVNVTATSSMGRLFDAVSSLVGCCHTVTYEGQAAIELEAIATADFEGEYRFEDETGVIDPVPVIAAVVGDLMAGDEPAAISVRFHRAVAGMIVSLAHRHRRETGNVLVGLTGGVFQNRLLSELTERRLTDEGFTVLTHARVPANDGGLALGQAVVAGHRTR